MKSSTGKPSKQFALTIVVFILVVVFMAIIFNFRINKSLEKFALENLALEDLNQFKKARACNRKLEFINFVTQTYNASERSLLDVQSRTGTCPSNMSKATQTPELSHLEENKIPYSLKSMCIKLKYEIFDRDDGNNGNLITIYLDNNPYSIDNSVNLLYLFLLNPLYIEFEGSTAYIPEYDDSKGYNQTVFTSSFYTNYNKGKILMNKSNDRIACAFRRLIPENAASRNVTFNYSKVPSLAEVIPHTSDSYVNARVYFLESQSIQTAGLNMALDKYYKRDNKTGVIKIYNKNYQSEYKPNSDDYYFHQKMYVLLQNSYTPILTFKFEISVTLDNYKNIINKNIEILKVYIDTEIGKYIDCPNYESIDTKNSNILSASIYSKFGAQAPSPEKSSSIQRAIERDNSPGTECSKKEKAKSKWDISVPTNEYDSTYILKFSTSNNKTIDKCSNEPAGDLEIELPFAITNERTMVVVTVTPYEKIALCKWKMEEREYFTFKRSQKCNNNNNFAAIFSQRENNKDVINENINLAYDIGYVTNLNYVQLGHKHYLNDFYASR